MLFLIDVNSWMNLYMKFNILSCCNNVYKKELRLGKDKIYLYYKCL